MNRIRLLPENVANQIAAGEVVERPASVVKELVENALDAQATHIIVDIQAGGRSLIRVTDNGIGMSRDDALLCLERHATSKIHSAEDLHIITTMGFRGEALPSLASVSRLTLTTRERESQSLAATQIIIHGGKIIAVREAGAPPGTSVEARQLFFNLPARRKFLRGEETERAHIQHYLTLAALAFPGVAFSFTQDQRLVWQLPAVKTESSGGPPLNALQERLRALYGSEEALLPVNFQSAITVESEDDTPLADRSISVHIWGFIGSPGVSRATRENQHLFVNRRPVENRGLNFALMEGYHTALMKGRYPVACLFVEITPAEVDVNIHPAKREVKFRHENAVRAMVAQAVREALLVYHNKFPAKNAAQGNQPISTRTSSRAVNQPAQAVETQMLRTAEFDLSPNSTPGTGAANADITSSVSMASADPCRTAGQTPGQPDFSGIAGVSCPPSHGAPISTSAGISTPSATTHASDKEPAPLLAVPLRIIGVVGKLYVVLESDRGLVLLDQHAAHERILFEEMLKRLEQGQTPSQRLLLAETIELAPRDAQFLRNQLDSLSRLGVGLSEFGERTFLLDALPPFVRVSNARGFVLELVDELKAAGQAVNSWRLGETTIAKTVCRHAVKANDPLSGAEIENLVTDLRRCAMPYTCPHGRPTLIEMSFRELEKRFGRIQ